MKKLFIFILYLIVFIIISNLVQTFCNEDLESKGGVQQAIKNYQKDIDSLAKLFNLPPDYLMAVIMLESSGRKKVPVRYEASIYNKLKQLQDGKIDKFENIVKLDLKGIKTTTLKALSSSYGPFQIMGYKKYILNISLDELKGPNNLYYAIKWIDLSYGDLLRNGEFKDAFHFHNSGKYYPLDGKPQTHDPNYVTKGLKYQQYFNKTIYKKK